MKLTSTWGGVKTQERGGFVIQPQEQDWQKSQRRVSWGLSGLSVHAVSSLIFPWQWWGSYPEGRWGQ